MPATPMPVLVASGLVVGGLLGVAAEQAGLSPVPEQEPPVEEHVEVLGSAVAVLDCPAGTPIAELASGDVVLATGQADDGRWIEIRWPLDETGYAWVRAATLAAERGVEDLPEHQCEMTSLASRPATTTGAAATSSPDASSTTPPGRTTTTDPPGTQPPRRNAPARNVPRPSTTPTRPTTPGTPGTPTTPGTPGTTTPSTVPTTATTVPPTTPTTTPTTVPDAPPTLGDPASSQQVISTTDSGGGPCLPFGLAATTAITVSASDDRGAPTVTMTYRTVADGEVVGSGSISVEGPVDGVYRGTLGPLPPSAAVARIDTVAEVTVVATDSAGQQDTLVFAAALVVRCPV